MKLGLYLSFAATATLTATATVTALPLNDFDHDASALMAESDNFWQRELQGSLIPAPTPVVAPPPTAPLPCDLPVQKRVDDILKELRKVSDMKDIEQVGTSENLAAEWLIDFDSYRICPDDDKLIQRYVMALFYFSTEGGAWSSCGVSGDCESTRYLSGVNECEWFGVTCNADLCITAIDIEQTGLAGTIPAELEQLVELEILSLEQGGIGGTIPAELGSLKNLRILDLDFNAITGSIPDQIYDLSTLEQLDLNTNQITGILSDKVGKLVNLRLLQLYENLMTGTIPDTLGDIEGLVIAELFNNTFTGTMPSSVCDNRLPPTGSGSISGLTSDCFPNPIPQIECNCCTGCAAF